MVSIYAKILLLPEVLIFNVYPNLIKNINFYVQKISHVIKICSFVG